MNNSHPIAGPSHWITPHTTKKTPCPQIPFPCQVPLKTHSFIHLSDADGSDADVEPEDQEVRFEPQQQERKNKSERKQRIYLKTTSTLT